MARVSDKIALVTGAAAGIGRSAAFALAREGAHVVATDIDREGAEEVANEIRRGNRGAIAVKHDVRLEPDWKAAVDAAVREFGRLDVLVNNAGIGPSKPLLETSIEDWRAVMGINLDGVFLGIRIGSKRCGPCPRARAADRDPLSICPQFWAWSAWRRPRPIAQAKAACGC
jgi:NAD(P)-dependent dehydrogenase (short-subunit alcohol dehydrogenase family)